MFILAACTKPQQNTSLSSTDYVTTTLKIIDSFGLHAMWYDEVFEVQGRIFPTVSINLIAIGHGIQQ